MNGVILIKLLTSFNTSQALIEYSGAIGMFSKKTIRDADIKNRTVLVRVDYNVPLKDGQNGEKIVQDDTRIVASKPTIDYLISQGCKIVLMSHLGRPKGERDPALSLKPVALRASKVLGKPVRFCPVTVGEESIRMAKGLKPGEILLLENLRYDKAETKNDRKFSEKLSKLGDLYVNDAFGTAHRAHSSTVGVTEFLKPALAGFLIEKELKYLGSALANPSRPFTAILGGAKVSDKIPVINRLLDIVDNLIIGGGMMFTFIVAVGGEIGDSLIEVDKIESAKEFIARAKKTGKSIILPTDTIAAKEVLEDTEIKTFPANQIPSGWKGLDIGPLSVKKFKEIILASRTIVWNGPMGVFELKPFANGTFEVAHAIADSGAVSIIGGGDSVSAIKKSGVSARVTHISTGGGASIEFLEGKELPGIAALDDKE